MTSQLHLHVLCIFACMQLSVTIAYTQTISSVSNGNWNSPTTWSGGIIPEAANSSSIIIDHEVTVTLGSELLIDGLTINHSMSIQAGSAVTIMNGEGDDISIGENGQLAVYGTLICTDGAVITGTTSANTTFFHNSVYRDLSSSEGIIPIATWDPSSTFELVGLTGNRSMQSLQWGQSFGNFIYDCRNQGDFIEFRGLLISIAGDFVVKNTNGGILRLARSQNTQLTVGGDIVIEGPSEVWFGETGSNSIISVGGDFKYLSTATASSYFTTTGITTVVVNGDFEMNATGRLKFASQTSIGHTFLYLNGNVNFERGIMDALSTGYGVIIFNGEDVQYFNRTLPQTDIQGNITYIIQIESILDLRESLLSNSTSGDVQVYGTIRLGSTHSDGVIRGNIQIQGELLLESGSRVELNSSTRQFLGNDYPINNKASLVVTNPYGVLLLNDLVIGNDLILQEGDIELGTHSVQIKGDILVGTECEIKSTGNITLNGEEIQILSPSGSTFHNLIIQNQSGLNVELISELKLTGILTFASADSDMITNGHLRLLSNAETANGSGGIGALLHGNSLVGEVTIERFMNGVGRVYRYISSPINAATVYDLMDDFPITGTFNDPSEGPGIRSMNPSFFYYDEMFGSTIQEGWKPYPIAGNASSNILITGLGYAAFIREGQSSTTWDLKGAINHSNIKLPVTYHNTGNVQADGWNLVGNPYPCAIRWNSEEGWDKQHISSSIAILDEKAKRFKYWDGELGELTEGLLAMGQAFWIRTTDNDPVLEINESAKAISGATFYRKEQNIDYIEITLTEGSNLDKAYFRLRNGAHTGFDNFDIPKFDNERISLSINMENLNLALSAVESIPCYFEIPLRIKLSDQYAGHYTLSIERKGLFEGSIVKLYDQITGNTYDITTTDYYFDINLTDEGFIDRFILQILSRPSDHTELSIPEYICSGETVQIDIKNLQHGFQYLLYNKTSDKFIPANTDAGFNITSDQLNDKNYLQLYSKNVCGITPVSEVYKIEKIKPPLPVLNSGFHCHEGSITLQSINADKNFECRWYEKNSSSPLHTGENFVTPLLLKSKTYFASMVHVSGCEGEKVPVLAEIIHYDEVILTFENNAIISSYPNGNTWYLDDILIPNDTNYIIVPLVPGQYKTEVYVGPCKSEASYLYQSSKVDSPEMLIYPNPGNERIFLTSTGGFIDKQLIDILSLKGNSVMYLCELEEVQANIKIVDITKLPIGIYIVQVKGTDYSQRFVKY